MMIKTKLERQTQTRRNLSGYLSSRNDDLPLGSAVEWLLKFFSLSLSLTPFNNISSDLAVDFLRTCLLLFRWHNYSDDEMSWERERDICRLRETF